MGYNGPDVIWGFGPVDGYLGIAKSPYDLPNIVELYEAAVYLDVRLEEVDDLLRAHGFEVYEYDDCGDPVYRRK